MVTPNRGLSEYPMGHHHSLHETCNLGVSLMFVHQICGIPAFFSCRSESPQGGVEFQIGLYFPLSKNISNYQVKILRYSLVGEDVHENYGIYMYIYISYYLPEIQQFSWCNLHQLSGSTLSTRPLNSIRCFTGEMRVCWHTWSSHEAMIQGAPGFSQKAIAHGHGP